MQKNPSSTYRFVSYLLPDNWLICGWCWFPKFQNYLGKCSLHEQNVVSVLKVARLFGLQGLLEASEKYLSSLAKKCLISRMTFVSAEESILPGIQEFQVQGLFCDVTLTTSGGRVIPVHKNILAAVSSYFQGLFRSEMKEVHEHNVGNHCNY